MEDPKVLYRYRHLQAEHREWTKKILTDSIIHFSDPRSFNDPFDCKIHFRPSISRRELKKKYAELVKNNIQNLPRAQRRAKVAKDMAKFDPEQFIKQMTNNLQEAVNRLGILSLSSMNNNILLWSHYAANHTGICLKFIASNTTPFFGLAQKVDYKTEFPEVDLLGSSPDEQVQSLLLTKAEQWQYENEWRIIDHDTGSGCKIFPEELLVEVIFGALMEPEDKDAIVGWVSKRSTPVQLSQVSIGSGSYSLVIEPYRP